MVDKKARFLESHEWARLDDKNTVASGLSDFAIQQLGDIVYMELPKVGTTLKKGQTYGIVESVKTAADMYAPVSGEVIQVNSGIPANPDILRTDAYNKGWLIKIRIKSTGEFESLMDADAYEKFLETQQH